MFASADVDGAQVSQASYLGRLMNSIQAGDLGAAEELRQHLTGGVTWYLRRNLGAGRLKETSEAVLDLIVATVRSAHLQSPRDLVSFSRTAVAFAVDEAKMIAATSPRAPSADRKSVEAMKTAMSELRPPDREALARYYEGQSIDFICSDYGLTIAEFRALRDRVSLRYAELKASPSKSLNRLAARLRPNLA